MNEWAEFVKFFAALMAILNPIGAIPVFITLTYGQTDSERRRTAAVTATAVAAVLGVSLVLGEALLTFFGISIASFRVGGGILVMLIAISMMHAKLSPVRHTQEEAEDAADRDSIAVVPLAIPLLAGPGAISTVILYAHRQESWLSYLVMAAVIAVVGAIVWTTLRMAPVISDHIGRTGINVVTRIMGLIMAAISVEFMANGLRQLFPGLA